MSYRYYAIKRSPVAHWLLDDTVPFQEYSGFSVSGTKKTGTSDPTKSTPLVSGAAYSSVFSRNSVGQFACNVFKQGLEDRPFALEAWVLPVPKSYGKTVQAYRENLLPSPSFQTDSNADGVADGWTLYTPGSVGTVTKSISTTGAYIGNGQRLQSTSLTNGSTNRIGINKLVPMGGNIEYTISVNFTANTALPTGMRFAIYLDFQNSVGGLIGSATSYPTTAGRKSLTFTSPAATANVNLYLWMDGGSAAAPAAIDYTIDAVLLEKSSVMNEYFDGSMAGAEWSGAAENSVSRKRADLSSVNLAKNPRAATGDGFLPNNGYWTREMGVAVTGHPLGITTASKQTVSSASAGAQLMSIYHTDSMGQSPLNRGLGAWFMTPFSGYMARVGVSGPWTNLQPGVWTWVTSPNTFTGWGSVFIQTQNSSAAPIGDYAFITGVVVTENKVPTEADYFDGSMSGAVWQGTANASESLMLISNSDQQILSRNSIFDGLSINGKVIRFGTSYPNFGNAYCDYDLQEYKLAHVVGIHNAGSNQLWVNGKKVSEVEISEDQKGDTYTASDGNLYSGYTLSSQEVAMNGVAFYPTLTAEQIAQNYAAGINALPQARVYPQYDGVVFNLDAANGSVYLDESWANQADFQRGLKNAVEYATDQINPSFVAGLSVAGTWTTAVPLDVQGDTSIYGVMLEWTGEGITVDVSLDGVSWTSETNGRLVSIVPNGYNPTGKDLQIRVTFASGKTQGYCYLESLRAVAFRNNSIKNHSVRTATATYPAVVRSNFEPNLYRDDNGISLNGGTLTIGPDTSPDPWIAKTVEIWIKPLSGTPAISVGVTKFRNGALDSTIPVGEWSLLHYVESSTISGNITISGDCIVGQVVLYPDALAAADADYIFKSYTGTPVIRITDPSAVSVSEGATPVDVYAHDWSISAAG